jgi:hypothetical protein
MDLSALSDRDVLDGLITYALEADELFEEWFSDPRSNSTFPASARAPKCNACCWAKRSSAAAAS